jgi:hypothetical protein
MGAVLYAPIPWFIEHPWLAFIPTLMFLAAAGHLRILGRGAKATWIGTVVASGIWGVYGVYEWCIPPDANIRVDLLIIAPILWVISVVGIVSYLLGLWGARSQQGSASMAS